MSKKPAPVVEPPKGFEIPNPSNHPAVVAVFGRLEKLDAKLVSVCHERAQVEQKVGAKPGESDDALEARLLARGLPTDDLTKLRELRRVERVTAQAVGLVGEDLIKAREVATREYTAAVREEVFLPGVRAAVNDWLDAAKRIEAFRLVVADIQGRRVGANTFSPFNGRVPVSLADRDAFAEFARELIRDGFTNAATINAAFPNLV
ncbi:MAG TPA: hypothetical protein VGE74_07890 [Gemmata sp.]